MATSILPESLDRLETSTIARVSRRFGILNTNATSLSLALLFLFSKFRTPNAGDGIFIAMAVPLALYKVR